MTNTEDEQTLMGAKDLPWRLALNGWMPVDMQEESMS